MKPACFTRFTTTEAPLVTGGAELGVSRITDVLEQSGAEVYKVLVGATEITSHSKSNYYFSVGSRNFSK